MESQDKELTFPRLLELIESTSENSLNMISSVSDALGQKILSIEKAQDEKISQMVSKFTELMKRIEKSDSEDKIRRQLLENKFQDIPKSLGELEARTIQSGIEFR